MDILNHSFCRFLYLLFQKIHALIHIFISRSFHEADFGIGLIDWLSLDYGSKIWAEKIEEAIQSESADDTTIMDAIKKYGFDSKSFCEKICKIYEKDYNRFM